MWPTIYLSTWDEEEMNSYVFQMCKRDSNSNAAEFHIP